MAPIFKFMVNLVLFPTRRAFKTLPRKNPLNILMNAGGKTNPKPYLLPYSHKKSENFLLHFQNLMWI